MIDTYKYNLYLSPNKATTKKLRINTADWLQQFAPTHFLSVQFPTRQRSHNLEKSLCYLKSIMKAFEKTLSPRHWNRKHLPFIVFAENTSKNWHFHIFLKNDR